MTMECRPGQVLHAFLALLLAAEPFSIRAGAA